MTYVEQNRAPLQAELLRMCGTVMLICRADRFYPYRRRRTSIVFGENWILQSGKVNKQPLNHIYTRNKQTEMFKIREIALLTVLVGV